MTVEIVTAENGNMVDPFTVCQVVIGSTTGRMQLWNFSTGTKLYTFSLAASRICCIVPSPALDVVGVGLADG